jgi:hypothetical protein
MMLFHLSPLTLTPELLEPIQRKFVVGYLEWQAFGKIIS